MVISRLSRFQRAALDLVFPRWCVGCGREGSFICPDCAAQLPEIEPPLCRRCGYPIAEGSHCPECRDWPPHLDSVRSPYRFESVIRTAIHQLKYRNLKALSDELAGLLYRYLIVNPIAVDVVVAVPIHPQRLRERGYNQCHLLARGLSKITDWPLSENSLIRTNSSESQTKTSDARQRWANVADAFCAQPDDFREQSVLLIDDVITSGATLNACAAAIKSAGALSVHGLTLAREI